MIMLADSMGYDAERRALGALVAARFGASMSVPEAFFAAEAEQIAEACLAMARRFHRGGRLLAFGDGAAATDAQHVAVEFVHPVIVGKRALPALALADDSAGGGPRNPAISAGRGLARQLQLLARPEDIAMGFSADGGSANVVDALVTSRERGLLTLALFGRAGHQEDAHGNGLAGSLVYGDRPHGGDGVHAGIDSFVNGDPRPRDTGVHAHFDHCFIVPSADPMVVQETHETLYHVLWELVHVFFEHEGLLA